VAFFEEATSQFRVPLNSVPDHKERCADLLPSEEFRIIGV
jgi:hypothetical protein